MRTIWVESRGEESDAVCTPARRRHQSRAEWSTDQSYGKSRTRLCFANPSHEAIRAGVAARAKVCRREFGVPARIANVERRASG
jgi:hypothetical protein